MTEAPDALARLFRDLWDCFLEGVGIDGSDLQDMIEKSGLAEWREATEADVNEESCFEVGDSILCLTEAGKAIVKQGRQKT